MLASTTRVSLREESTPEGRLLFCPCGRAFDCRSVETCQSCADGGSCPNAVFALGLRIPRVELGRIARCPACRSLHQYDGSGHLVGW